MLKKLSQLRYLREQELNRELKKIENAEKNYNNYSFFNSLSILLFVMSLIAIITACVYKTMLIKTNDVMIIIFIGILIIMSFSSLLASMFYNYKTIDIIKKHYNKIG